MMAKVKGNRGHGHSDTVAYLEGLGEEGAAVLRAREGGYTRYWLEGDEVRSCDITEDELPLAGFGTVMRGCSEKSSQQVKITPPPNVCIIAIGGLVTSSSFPLYLCGQRPFQCTSQYHLGKYLWPHLPTAAY